MSTTTVRIAVHPGPTGQVTVAVVGALDLESSGLVTEAVLDAAGARDPGDVVLDLSAVDFLDSSGINVLLLARSALQQEGSTLRIGAMSAPVRRVLDLVSLVDLLAPTAPAAPAQDTAATRLVSPAPLG